MDGGGGNIDVTNDHNIAVIYSRWWDYMDEFVTCF